MPDSHDPFRRHPELRDKIKDPKDSFFNTFDINAMVPVLLENNLPVDWWYTDQEREAIRADALSGHNGDLWVFAYGSLMWDPAFQFSDLRRATAHGYQRQFIAKDVKGARGTPEQPGLMAALDIGTRCDGILLKIDADRIESETEILFRREMIAPGYQTHFISCECDDQAITAMTFLANHDSDFICAELTRDDKVSLLATGEGFLGTSLEYISNIVAQLHTLGINDHDVVNLMEDAIAFQQKNAPA